MKKILLGILWIAALPSYAVENNSFQPKFEINAELNQKKFSLNPKQPQEDLTLKVQILNNSPETIHFLCDQSCGFWAFNIQRISLGSTGATMTAQEVTLKPGESREELLPIRIDDKTPADVLRFEAGFSPKFAQTSGHELDKLKYYWSNQVQVKVIGKTPKHAKKDTPEIEEKESSDIKEVVKE